MKVKQIITLLVFANIFLAVGFSAVIVSISPDSSKTFTGNSVVVDFIVKTDVYANSAQVTWGGSKDGEIINLNGDSAGTTWTVSDEFTPGFYEYLITVNFNGNLEYSDSRSFTIVPPTPEPISQTTSPTAAGGPGAGGTDNTGDPEPVKNETDSAPESLGIGEEDSDGMTIPEIIHFSDNQVDNSNDDNLEEENLGDEIIEEGPVVEIAPSPEEPKKGICGPTLLILLVTVPLAVSKAQYRR